MMVKPERRDNWKGSQEFLGTDNILFLDLSACCFEIIHSSSFTIIICGLCNKRDILRIVKFGE